MPNIIKDKSPFSDGFFEERALYECSDFNEALQGMLEAIGNALDTIGCHLGLYDPVQKSLLPIASTGSIRPNQGGAWPWTAQDLVNLIEKNTVQDFDPTEETRTELSEANPAEKVGSVVGIPLHIKKNMHMVLSIFFRKRMSRCEQNSQLYSVIKHQSTFLIKNALRTALYTETFRKITAAIHKGEKIDTILNSIVSHVREVVDSRGCIYWIVDTTRKIVHMKATSGFEMESLSSISYDTLKDVFRFEENKEIFIKDVWNDPRIPRTTSLGKQMVTAILGIPFSIVDQYTGILAVYFSRSRRLLQTEIDFVHSLGKQGAISLYKTFRHDEHMIKTFRETIEGLVLALEAKDVCTHGHSLNVATYAHLIASQMGLPEQEIDTIYHAALLHDIGKIAMQDEILLNLGNLPAADFETVKKHPVIGARIIGPLSFLSEAAQLILYHHERYDGSGYPEGLTGGNIPIGARIIAVSDSFDAMTSQRPCRQSISINKALSVLLEQAGTSFDPKVVSAFVIAIQKNMDKVKPYTLSQDYFEKHANTFESTEKHKSSLMQRLRDWLPRI